MSLNHMMFGVNNIDSNRTLKYSDENIESNINSLITNISEFESKYDRFISSTLYNDNEIERLIKFEKNHRARTTSVAERIERIKILIENIGE